MVGPLGTMCPVSLEIGKNSKYSLQTNDEHDKYLLGKSIMANKQSSRSDIRLEGIDYRIHSNRFIRLRALVIPC